MIRQQVRSSSLRAVGYDPEAKTLEIEFVHGEVYEYLNVDSETYQSLLSAESLGAYFQTHIRLKFVHHRIG